MCSQIGRHELRVRAWAWLAAEVNESAKKARCLEAILVLDPGVEWARVALREMRRPRGKAYALFSPAPWCMGWRQGKPI